MHHSAQESPPGASRIGPRDVLVDRELVVRLRVLVTRLFLLLPELAAAIIMPRSSRSPITPRTIIHVKSPPCCLADPPRPPVLLLSSLRPVRLRVEVLVLGRDDVRLRDVPLVLPLLALRSAPLMVFLLIFIFAMV